MTTLATFKSAGETRSQVILDSQVCKFKFLPFMHIPLLKTSQIPSQISPTASWKQITNQVIEDHVLTTFPSFEDGFMIYIIVTIGRVSSDKTIVVSQALRLTFFHYLISGFSTAFTPHSTEWKSYFFSDLLCLVFSLSFHVPCFSP